MKQDFNRYKIGTVFNPARLSSTPRAIYESVEIKYPMRLNSMALDPSKIVSNNNMIYTPGEITLSIGLFTRAKIRLVQDDTITINSFVGRETVIRHAAEIMKKTFSYTGGFEIDLDADASFPHSGLGSSGGILSTVICGINELFGNPISPGNMVKFIAQNYGEEIEDDDKNINPVQCIGGSACSGNYSSGLIIIAGQSEVIGVSDVSNSYEVIIGIPSDFVPKDSAEMLALEIIHFPKFQETGQRYSREIAYRLIHEVLPSLKNSRLNEVGDLIFDYRFNMGSIENCSFCYEGLTKLAEDLKQIKENGLAEILSLSSVGPAFFVVTKNSKECEEIFIKNNLLILKTKVWNNKYECTFGKI